MTIKTRKRAGTGAGATAARAARGGHRYFACIGQMAALVIVAVGLQGCVPLIVMHSVDHEQDHQHYSDYVTQTNQLNFEREKAGLQPEPVMTFDQWNGS